MMVVGRAVVLGLGRRHGLVGRDGRAAATAVVRLRRRVCTPTGGTQQNDKNIGRMAGINVKKVSNFKNTQYL